MKVIYKISAVIMFLISAFLLLCTIALLSTVVGAIVSGALMIASLIFGIKLWKKSKPEKTITNNIDMFQIQPDTPTVQKKIPDGEMNYDILDDVVNGYYLKYQYENNLFVQNFAPIVGNGGENIKLAPEPENQYDSETIAAYLNGEKIAYIYKGQTRDMIHDWIKRDWLMIAYINKYNKSERTATYKIGFYKPLETFENHEYRLIKISKKADEFGMSRYDNISCLSEGDEVTVDDDLIVYDIASEIGELPKSAEGFIESCQETVAILSEMDEDYDEKITAKVTVYKIK